ncbi:Gfo/Idh/MocA family protein [Streptomyces osmaniensis]|uniref:Gfo/Idh/MocA-like oxidoreductase N-terminal domain-containing protein n=1 Tax=Streptomyces osmaniensis TaxID=593134 RepID=A0ABP6WBE3_9ACTN
MSRTPQRRAVVVGTGHRARTFTRALAERPGHVVAALCDPSPTRMAFHNRLLADAGEPAATEWEPGRFADLLAEEDIDEVVVTTVDAEHDRYIVPAIEAGCRVVTEKPMTVDAERCARILDTVRSTGNSLTVAFHLTAYSPWEGYRVMFNGSAGRLELEVEESRWQRPTTRIGSAGGALHGETAAEHAGGARLTLRPLWRAPLDIPLVTAHEAHGGGDPRMLDALFGPVDGTRPADAAAVTHPTATERDGALALAVGLAANPCFETGLPVAVAELVPGIGPDSGAHRDQGEVGEQGDQVQAR